MFPKIKIGTLVLLFFIIAVVLSSCSDADPPFQCTDSIGCITLAPGEPLKIGVLQALSGKVAPLGQAQIRGLELALDKRNNTIFGHPIVLQIEDTGCTEEGGANAALKIIADPQTVAIFGSTCSGAAATASHAMSEAGLTMISGNNSAAFLTSTAGKAAPKWRPGFFRTTPSDENAGKAAAAYVFQQLGLQRAATINDGDIYTRGLTDSFHKAFTDLGGVIVLDATINKGEQEMEPVLKAVINSGAQLIFFPLFQPEGNNLLFQARKLSALNDTLLISSGSLIDKSFLDEVGEVGKGMCFVSPIRPTGVDVEKLAAAYETKYEEKPAINYYLNGYDAADLLFHAIEQTAIKKSDGTLYLGRQTLRDTLYRTFDFKGVTGTLSCTQFGDCSQPAFEILRLDNPSLGIEGLYANRVFSSVFKNN